MKKIVNIPELELQIIEEPAKKDEDKILDLLKKMNSKLDLALKNTKNEKTN